MVAMVGPRGAAAQKVAFASLRASPLTEGSRRVHNPILGHLLPIVIGDKTSSYLSLSDK